MTSVCILDYGSGNVKSVFNLFTAICEDVVVSNEVSDIRRATHIVLPGVGAFAAAMRKITQTLPLDEIENAVLTQSKPFLGICVGMQVLATYGLEFERSSGLGWIAGGVEKLQCGTLPLPHIGWNNVDVKGDAPLLAGLGAEPDFYFVHSFAFEPEEQGLVLGTTSYGPTFCSAVQRGNLCGVQFHPEKSQRAGLRLARNFLSMR